MSAAATPTAAQLREQLGAQGNNARCPAHDDQHGSLSIGEGNGGKPLLKCHAGCAQSAVIEALRGRGIWPRSSGLTVAELAAAKRLPESLLRESGFVDDEIRGRPVVRMDYRDSTGNVICTRYRGALAANGTDQRFWFRRGDKQQLFGLWRLRPEPVILVEGETDAIALWDAGLNAIGVPGADAWHDRFASPLEPCATLYVHVEPDRGGEKFRAALSRSRLRDRVRFFTVAPGAKDPCELRAANSDAFRERMDRILRATHQQHVEPSAGFASAPPERSDNAAWPEPKPLPVGLPPVEPFDYDLLPPVLRARVEDVSERMQCPPDFPAVALMVSLSSLVGRRCGIAPKRADDWTVVPNLWGMIIGRPGVMKSPPLTEIMRPLQVLQAHAVELFERQQADFQAGAMVAAEAERVAKDAIRKLLKAGKTGDAHDRAHDAVARDSAEPVCRRYVVNDSTVEKLGEILNENPCGVLLHRDELAGFFRTLERQGHEADRAFYLECWNGDGSFTYDRIGRGTFHIAGACLSIIGSIQPGPLSELLRGQGGAGDDGLLQRFQLAVWPDVGADWRNVDRAPDQPARHATQSVIDRLAALTAERLGADPALIPALHFADDAQQLFDVWREGLEKRLRSDAEHPMLEAHLAKYRSLVPSLSLILHLAVATEGPVDHTALERAIAWAEYLETHAKRIYAPAISPDMDAARALLRHIRKGDVSSDFALRDIYRAGWSGLGTREQALAAIAVLEEHDWIKSEEQPTAGRSRTVYRIHPVAMKDNL